MISPTLKRDLVSFLDRWSHVKTWDGHEEASQLLDRLCCGTCDGTGEIENDCTCYELVGGGHQMGCPFYGKNADQILELMLAPPAECPDCTNHVHDNREPT